MVDCKHCKYLTDDGDSFDVSVPINDKESGISGNATLHCTVSDTGHSVELLHWFDDDEQPIQPSENLSQRVESTLCQVADKKLCGNCHICPPQVVDIVKQNTRH